MNNTPNIQSLSDFDLLEEYEYVVQRNHYDPVHSRTPLYDYDTLRAEVERRLAGVKSEINDDN